MLARGDRRAQQIEQRPGPRVQPYPGLIIVVFAGRLDLARYARQRGFQILERDRQILGPDRTGNLCAEIHHFQQLLTDIAEHGNVGIGLRLESDQHG